MSATFACNAARFADILHCSGGEAAAEAAPPAAITDLWPLAGLHVALGTGAKRDELAQAACALQHIGASSSPVAMPHAINAGDSADASLAAGTMPDSPGQLPPGGEGIVREAAAAEIAVQQECLWDWLHGAGAQAWDAVTGLEQTMWQDMERIVHRAAVHSARSTLMQLAPWLSFDSAHDLATVLVPLLEWMARPLQQMVEATVRSLAGREQPGEEAARHDNLSGEMRSIAALAGELNALLMAKGFRQGIATLANMFLRWTIEAAAPDISEPTANDVSELLVEIGAGKWRATCAQGMQVALKNAGVYLLTDDALNLTRFWKRTICKAFIAISIDGEKQLKKQGEKLAGIGLTVLTGWALRMAVPGLHQYTALDIADALCQGLAPRIAAWNAAGVDWVRDALVGMLLSDMVFEPEFYDMDESGYWSVAFAAERL